MRTARHGVNWMDSPFHVTLRDWPAKTGLDLYPQTSRAYTRLTLGATIGGGMVFVKRVILKASFKKTKAWNDASGITARFLVCRIVQQLGCRWGQAVVNPRSVALFKFGPGEKLLILFWTAASYRLLKRYGRCSRTVTPACGS